MPKISKATEYNWKKLNSDSTEKLTRRANKTLSGKKIRVSSYLHDAKANALLQRLSNVGSPVADIVYTLVCAFLSHKGLLGKPHVQRFLRKYEGLKCLDIAIDAELLDSEDDLLGFVYQSLTLEGERNKRGQYYTCRGVVDAIVGGKELGEKETFLDPCCGSGAFLMSVRTDNPSNLYGFDTDALAVLIAAANLFAKYWDKSFCPNIFCMDFLERDLMGAEKRDEMPDRFDYIYTNPPWGSDKEGLYAGKYPEIRSKERASMFVVEALRRLKREGTLYFLLPSSLLKTKVHSDIRKYILENATIEQVDLYKGRFDGVFTDYFGIRMRPIRAAVQHYLVGGAGGSKSITLSNAERGCGKISLKAFGEVERRIMEKMESACHERLNHSQWALGIVTGDNKRKVRKERGEGWEAVYGGKDVGAFKLKEERSYLLFEPKDFQQCAREDYYRAPEKLIYRFIARYPVVAYDDRGCLCLNSANILIPKLEGISTKSVAALLNSTLYHYYYRLRFDDIKVLKGNLEELPFPRLTREQDADLSDLVSRIQNSSFTAAYQKLLDRMVYEIFGIDASEQAQILARIRRWE